MNMGWGSMFDLLLFLLYAWCARFVGPTVAICSFYFLAMRCRYSSILILSWREEHHQTKFTMAQGKECESCLGWLKKGEEEGRKNDEVHIAERSFL